MPKSLSSLSVVVPCYNEAANLPTLLKNLAQVLPKVTKSYQVIIVNDGSTDPTKQVLQTMAKKHAFVQAVHHIQNHGYGAAIRSGLRQVKKDWVFITDGDNQFDLGQLSDFVAHSHQCKAVIGYRSHRVEGWRRTINANIFKLYINILFGLGVKDIDCAFKLIQTRFIQPQELSASGALISTEILFRLKQQRVAWLELPVRHLPRPFGQPTGSNWHVITRAVWESWQLFYSLRVRGVIS